MSLPSKRSGHPLLTSWFHFRWIAGKISDILGNEDDVVIELCFNLLEGSRFVSDDSIPNLSTIANTIMAARDKGPPNPINWLS